MANKLIISIILLLVSVTAHAGTNVTFPFSSTFNCPNWTQTDGQSYEDIAGCTGWQQDADWTTSSGSRDVINSTHNNPAGGGVSGYGHAVGDGTNNGAGCIRMTFAAQQELYIRFYMKYPLGFTWAGAAGTLDEYQKIWYTNPQDSDNRLLVFQMKYSNDIGYWLVNTTGGNADVTGYGWEYINGGTTGDGEWHCYESHIKAGNPGQLRTWIDGVLVQNDTTANVGGTDSGGWSVLELLTNQKTPANGSDKFISIDDFAVQTTGPIGCLSASISVPTGVGVTFSGASLY